MPKIRFTDVVVKALKPGLYFDERTPSFGIRIGANRKTWLIVKGENRTKVRLGYYPAVSLSDARKLAQTELATASPAQPNLTFPDAREKFLEQGRWRESSRRVIKSSLNHFRWKRAIAKISYEDVTLALEAIAGDSARAHALKDIRAFFNWCVPRYLERSPCAGMSMPHQQSRDRVLSDKELVRVWNAADQIGAPFGRIVQLLVLTGQRKSEIGELVWSYVGKDTVTLPSTVTKNGQEHTFPLGDVAKSLLPKRGDGYLFRATGSEGRYNGYYFHLKKLQEISETSGWTLHDLRRTFATSLASLGVPIHVTEKLLEVVPPDETVWRLG